MSPLQALNVFEHMTNATAMVAVTLPLLELARFHRGDIPLNVLLVLLIKLSSPSRNQNFDWIPTTSVS